MSNQTTVPYVFEISSLKACQVFEQFANDPWAIFLDSADLKTKLARYSFIAVDPFLTLSSKNGQVVCANESIETDPFVFLKNKLSQFLLSPLPELPPFQGGVAGYFGYDLCHHLEKFPLPKLDESKFADLMLGFYDLVIAFDHQEQRSWIFSSGFPETDLLKRKKRAFERYEFLYEKIFSYKRIIKDIPKSDVIIHSNFTKEQYLNCVKKAIEYIYAGDIFQVNLSQCFSAQVPAGFDFFAFYTQLRKINPAPFAAYLNFPAAIIVSSSPERFLKLNEGLVESRPIKGTRPRGKTEQEDHFFKQELLLSEKDQAENIMIVDLIRNDLSRVCLEHSIVVTQLCALESYETVHHLVSVVLGKLKNNYAAIDLLQATFPGGSITGAPKIRAMEIIAELEPTPRGPYCGSIGYIGFDGAMDLSIAIRTFAAKAGKITFQAGGGIVADSDPELEYEETLIKAKGLKQALGAITPCET